MGILLGSMIAGFISFSLPEEAMSSFGWRLASALGDIFGLFAVRLRCLLEETPVFQVMKNRQ